MLWEGPCTVGFGGGPRLDLILLRRIGMAPVKPSKRSQSTQRYYRNRMKIKRESVKHKRESIARTPRSVPVNVQEAPCGVYRVPNIPDDCRKGGAYGERARRVYVTQLTTQYAQQNKVVVGARWM